MTEKSNEEIDVTEAVAKDYYALIQRDLSIMSPGQLEITKKALADFEAKNRDTSQRDFEKKISRMTDAQLREFVRDCDDERRGSV